MGPKDPELKDIIIKKINKSYWWHVSPRAPKAFKKRGKFLASTYSDAEFYGRPNDDPEKVYIKNPVFGFSELEIIKQIIPGWHTKKIIMEVIKDEYRENWYKMRVAVDAMMYRAAKKLGYDAIVLICRNGHKALLKNRKPKSIELNLLY